LFVLILLFLASLIPSGVSRPGFDSLSGHHARVFLQKEENGYLLGRRQVCGGMKKAAA